MQTTKRTVLDGIAPLFSGSSQQTSSQNNGKTMMFLKTIIATTALLISISVLAHTGIKSTFPANEQSLTEAPTQLTLTFSGPVRLMKVLMSNSEAEALDIEFKPTAQANKSFDVALPDLEKGQYLVSWVSMGKDGHKMKGDFSFTVTSEGVSHDN